MGATSTHFTHAELACRHCGRNECTQALVDALEALRTRVGLPLTVNDAYRCPEHNAAVGGVRDSQHLQGIAADIRVPPGWTPETMYLAANEIPAFARGGIGVAMHQNYIHVDLRPNWARWCYDIHGRACAWDPQLGRVPPGPQPVVPPV